MAGQPGKSGGARKGAGRPRKEVPEIQMAPTDDPLEFLTQVMNDPAVELRMRADVAKALLPFKHQKLGEGGKKQQRLDGAKAAGLGKFGGPLPPPRLVSNGKK